MATMNRQYKDRLFTFLFGNEAHKDWTLSLYNAVNGSSYTEPELIEISTIREVVYMGMHNDVSFFVGNELHLYEQQSTYNPNMPVRMLQYSGDLYEKFIKQNQLNKYGSNLLRLPAPRMVVFYNGTQDRPPEMTLLLSDSFPPGSTSDVEVRVRMINLNHSQSQSLLDACKVLKEYSYLIDEIRMQGEHSADMSAAIDLVISRLPDTFIIKPLIEAHKAEVHGMLQTEYDEAEAMKLFHKDGLEEGIAQGLEEGLTQGLEEGLAQGQRTTLLQTASHLMDSLSISPEEALKLMGVPADQQPSLIETLSCGS